MKLSDFANLPDDQRQALINEARDNSRSVYWGRRFMAQTVVELGRGGQRLAERELGWQRDLIRKGAREVASGVVCVDAFGLRGRRRSKRRLPNLLSNLSSIVDSQSQSDPQFRTNRLYTRLSAAEVGGN